MNILGFRCVIYFHCEPSSGPNFIHFIQISTSSEINTTQTTQSQTLRIMKNSRQSHRITEISSVIFFFDNFYKYINLHGRRDIKIV